MLRALLFAALFAAVLAVVYTKSTSAEDVIKKLDANQEKLDQLNARIQNLKNKLKARVAAREEADRKSKNMLLRLDRMDIKDGSYHCHKSTDGRQTNFKCRTGQQCVPNILVCDNKVDCEDGSDEDEDFCTSPVEVGVKWGGRNTFYNCTPGTDSKEFKVQWIAESFKRLEFMPSFAEVDEWFYWNENNYQIKSLSVSSRYYFATRSIIHEVSEYENSLLLFKARIVDDGVIYFETFRGTDKFPCERNVVKRNQVVEFPATMT